MVFGLSCQPRTIAIVIVDSSDSMKKYKRSIDKLVGKIVRAYNNERLTRNTTTILFITARENPAPECVWTAE